MRKSFCLTCLALLLCSFSLRAQWSGHVDLALGLGGMDGGESSEDEAMIHALTRGAFQLNYKSEKFLWNIRLEQKWEPKTTDNGRYQYKNERSSLQYKAAFTSPLSVNVKSDFSWMPTKEQKYSAWILYQYRNDRASNHTLNANTTAEAEDLKFSYYYEVPVMDEHKVETGIRTHRSFHSGRSILESSLSFEAIGSQRMNTWVVFKAGEGNPDGGTKVDLDDIEGYAWMYRITPSSLDSKLNGDVHFQRTVLEGTSQLKLTPGFRLTAQQALDRNSGATRILPTWEGEQEEQWRDSTRLRENFNYLSLSAEPYLVADFKWRNIEAHADYAAQVYGRRLCDDTHWEYLKIRGVYPVGRANVKWTISPGHSLNLTNRMSVAHPEYLKICWYDRTAGYLDQLYRGNESLLSPTTSTYGLEYEFKYKRFLSQTSVSYAFVENEVDQTWTNEEIEGRQYKVFKWLNSADSRSFGVTQKLGWRGKVITANAGVTYNRSRRVAKHSGEIKDSYNWRLNADISARLGKGWSMGMDARYQSKVATFFTIFKEYCELNARIQKDFRRVSLYLEGRDLLDQPRETSFESEDLQEYWVEVVRSNRRLFVLGAKWNF